MKKSNLLFIGMIIVICSFINELSVIGMLMLAIGFSLVITMLEIPLMYGGEFIKKMKRRISLAIGTMLTIIAFLGEINWVAFGMFAVGVMITVFVLNRIVEEKA